MHFATTTLAVISTLMCSLALQAKPIIPDGAVVAFMGDSITEAGWGNQTGYVRLVESGLAANGIQMRPIPVGISGHKSNDMLNRLKKDVLENAQKPTWMTLSCGVNDVWHGKNGVPLNTAIQTAENFPADRGTYEQNITRIVDETIAAGIKPVILTATVIHENLDSPENKKLAPYNEFLRKLAREKKLPLADLNAAFQQAIKRKGKPGTNLLTSDGVHMNPEGDRLMAITLLRTFGLNDQQLKVAEDAWAKNPK